jgi:hypothetical protein
MFFVSADIWSVHGPEIKSKTSKKMQKIFSAI